MTSSRTALAGLLVAGLAVTSASASGSPTAYAAGHPVATTSAAAVPSGAAPTDHPHFPKVDLGRARNKTRKDSVYPGHGSPVVDALRYELRLGWRVSGSRLSGSETLTFRATRDAQVFRLDLAPALKVSAVGLDGEKVTAQHTAAHLVVTHPVRRNQRYVLRVHYAGAAVPLPAPTTRDDVPDEGLTPSADGGAWTIQEPYGASTWYAANDQPSDKAFYDVDLATPAPLTGISNGVLLHRTTRAGVTSTWWHLGDPAAAYLSTVAIGDYRITHARSSGGVPFVFATPRGDDKSLRRVRRAPAGLDWVEKVLGPYPFSSLGIVIVPSDSAEETETMMTIGDQTYDSTRSTLVHEMVHQWYGDEVTPNDWRDVWMNEGMATYLEARYDATHGGEPLAQAMGRYAAFDQEYRDDYGPPAAYDKRDFASNNVYYPPALMWDQLRKRIGNREFFSMIRAWPRTHAFTSQGRGTYLSWIQTYTHRDLRHFFHAWLLGKKTPSVS